MSQSHRWILLLSVTALLTLAAVLAFRPAPPVAIIATPTARAAQGLPTETQTPVPVEDTATPTPTSTVPPTSTPTPQPEPTKEPTKKAKAKPTATATDVVEQVIVMQQPADNPPALDQPAEVAQPPIYNAPAPAVDEQPVQDAPADSGCGDCQPTTRDAQDPSIPADSNPELPPG